MLVEARVEQNRHAGQLAERHDQPMESRVCVAVDRLDAGSAINVNHGRYLMRLCGSDAGGVGHKRVRLADFKVFARTLLKYGWSKRAKRFTDLDALVDNVLDFQPERRSENGAVAQRARADLEPALEPPDDFAVGEIAGHAWQKLMLAHPLIAKTCVFERSPDLVVAELRADEGMRHTEVAIVPEGLVVVPEGAAEWSAGVGGARRYPDVFEVGVLEQARIGNAVECYTAAQAQVARRVGLDQAASNVDHHLFRHLLQRASNVAVAIGDGLVAFARRPEQIDEFRLEGPQHAVCVVGEIRLVDREAAPLQQVHDVAHLLDQSVFAARGKRHNGPFLEGLEPQVQRYECIDHAEAVEEFAMPLAFEPVPDADKGACGRIIAIPVHDQDRRVLERRYKVDRGMRLVVSNTYDLGPPTAAEMSPEILAEVKIQEHDPAILRRVSARLEQVEAGRKISQYRREKAASQPPNVPRCCDDIDVLQRAIGGVEDRFQRLNREPKRVLLPIETLLFDNQAGYAVLH